MRPWLVPVAAAAGVATVIGVATAGGSLGARVEARSPAPAPAPAPSSVVDDVQMWAAQDEGSIATSAPFPTDAHGWSYGAIPQRGAAPYADWPDLVAVALGGSEVGFVRKAELRFSDDPADNPTTPAQMLAFAKTLPATVAIYAPDGTTVLGSMPVAPATSPATP